MCQVGRAANLFQNIHLFFVCLLSLTFTYVSYVVCVLLHIHVPLHTSTTLLSYPAYNQCLEPTRPRPSDHTGRVPFLAGNFNNKRGRPSLDITITPVIPAAGRLCRPPFPPRPPAFLTGKLGLVSRNASALHNLNGEQLCRPGLTHVGCVPHGHGVWQYVGCTGDVSYYVHV